MSGRDVIKKNRVSCADQGTKENKKATGGGMDGEKLKTAPGNGRGGKLGGEQNFSREKPRERENVCSKGRP